MKCDKCKKNEAIIMVQGVGNFCLDCNNEILAEMLDMKLFKEYSKQLTVIDDSGKYHIFEISNMVMPGYSKWEATEQDGYSFEVMIGTDEDQYTGLKQLQSKIFKALSYRSLHPHNVQHTYENAVRINGVQYGLKSIGTGRVSSDSMSGDSEQWGIVIDGAYIPFYDFGRMASTYSGFIMEYQFRDATEEPLSKNMALKKVDISKEAVLFRFDRYQRWLLTGNKLSKENETEYLQAMKECIDDLSLMLIANLRTECKEAAEIMIAKLMSVESASQALIDKLIDAIDRETWFLFLDELE